MAAVNQSPGKSTFTFLSRKVIQNSLKMLLMVLACLVGFTSSQVFSSESSRQQITAPKGFINTNGTKKSSGDYFTVTDDGRLQRIQLVFPEGSQQISKSAVPFLLTPDGRLEKLEQDKKENVVQYFKLTEDGRLQAIKEEDVPSDAQEESGEYHVLLPTGRLQRVRFMTTTKGNLLSAKVQYQEVQPISGPVYRYANPLVRVV